MERIAVLALLASWLVAATASADIVTEPPIARPTPSVHLARVAVVASDAPASDTAAVQREVRSQLAARQRRIDRCLRGADLRESPLRSRPRSLRGRLVFTRSGRPAVTIDRVRGVPRIVRTCIEEAARSVAVRSAPRGTVTVRFTYRID